MPANLLLIYLGTTLLNMAINLGAQAAVMQLPLSATLAVPLSMLAGTLAGPPFKYVLEKRFVFNYKSESLAHDGQLFASFMLTAGPATLVFWGVEWAFHVMYGSDAMRYLGGAIGLSLGAVLKYHLDRRFVFIDRVAKST